MYNINLNVKKRPFPKYTSKNWIEWFFQFLFWMIIWIFFIFIFLVIAFSKILWDDIVYFVNLFHKKYFYIPLWVSLLITIFFFPVALVAVICIEILKRIKD